MFESQTKLLFDSPFGVVHSRKLDTALRDSTVKQFTSRYYSKKFKFDDRLFLHTFSYHFPHSRLSSASVNSHVWPKLFDKIISGYISHSSDKIRRAAELSLEAVTIQLHYNDQSNKDDRTRLTPDHYKNLNAKLNNLPPELMSLVSASLRFGEMIERLGSVDLPMTYKERQKFKRIPPLSYFQDGGLKMKVCWSRNIACIQLDRQLHLVPRDYLLLIHNKCSDLVSMLLFCHLSESAGLEKNCFQNTITFLKGMSHIISLYQNNGYTILKAIESIGIGITLIDVDGQTNSVFLKEIILDLIGKFGFNYESSTVYEIMKNASIPFRHELMCLMKTMGHPYVDMKLSVEQLHNITTTPLSIDVKRVADCVRFAKRSYIKTHLLRKHQWPPCTIIGSKRLQLAKSENRDPDAAKYTKQFGLCPIDEYDWVELEPNMQFDKCINLIPYIKDKTISAIRSSVVRKYQLRVARSASTPVSKDAQDALKQDNELSDDTIDPPDVDIFSSIDITDEIRKPNVQTAVWSETRLLLYYMMNTKEATDHLNYIHHFLDNEDLDYDQFLDYFVQRIVPKEKEMKVDGRGYGCKTFLDRARSVISEHNVKQFLDEYCSEQAITLSELETLHKLINFRRVGLAYQGFEPLYIVVDSSKWNNRFRTETVNPITKHVVDKIFDNHFASHNMPVFENTLIYVPNGNEVWWWWGQWGGIEGHHQYLWDVVYLSQIRTAIQKCGYDPILFVKGDDLRAIIMIPPHVLKTTTKESIRTLIVTSIRDNIKHLGHKINVNESYGSSHYFAFSKSASVDKIELPQTFRKIEKCYGANNAFLPFLDEYVGSSFSNAHSSSKMTSSVVHCYSVAIYWMFLHLTHKSIYSQLSNDQLIALHLVPGLLGGFPIIYLHNMWVRAESDLLSPFLGLLKMLKAVNSPIFDCAANFLKVNAVDPIRGFKGLLIDPYSLPIKKPISASSDLRNRVKSLMRKFVKHEDLIALISAAEGPEMQAIIDCLASANVYPAKIFSAIYDASPSGLLDEMIRKFESGRSVIQIITTATSRRFAGKLIRQIISNERRIHRHRTTVLKGKHTYTANLIPLLDQFQCPAQLANHIRELLWTKPIEEITMPPIQHQLILYEADAADNPSYAHRNHFVYLFTPLTKNLGVNLPTYSSGDQKPFVGYTTKLGVVTAKEKLVDKNEVTEKAKKLIDLLSWVRSRSIIGNTPSANLEMVIFKLLTFYFDVDPTLLTPFGSSRKQGTKTHHIRAPEFRESIVANSLSNLYTRFSGNSTAHIRLRWSSDHFRVNFLHIYCHALFLITIRMQLSNDDFDLPLQFWGVTVDCDYCNTPIVESPVTVDLNHISSITFSRFHETNLSAHAKEIIEQSVSSAHIKLERLVNPVDELDFEVACDALIQDLLIMGHIQREKLNDFAYRHTMNAEAQDIMERIHGSSSRSHMSQTEMKSIPMSRVFDNLIVSVVEFVYFQYRDSTEFTALQFIADTPPSEFPWYQLIVLVYESGHLTTLIRHAAKRSTLSAPDCYDSPAGASTFIAMAAFHVFKTNRFPNIPVVYMSDFQISDLARYITPRAKLVKHKLAKIHLYNKFETMMKTKETRLILQNMLIVYWSVPLFDQESLLEKIKESGLNTRLEVNILDYDLLDPSMIPTLEDMPGCCQAALSQKFGRSHDDAVFELETDAELLMNTVNQLKGMIEHIFIQFIYVAHDACISKIRSRKKIKPYMRGDQTFHIDMNQTLQFEDPELDSYRMFKVHFYSVSTPMSEIQDKFIIPDTPYSFPLHLKPWYLYRFQGFGTSAPSKLAEIFQSLGLTSLPDGIAVSCLADGHGGFLAFIDKMTKSSVFLFNTLITTPTMEAHPSHWDSTSSANDVNYEALSEQYHNLELVETMIRLEKTFPYHSLIITVDAQTIGLDIQRRENLIDNVLIYYLRNRLATGILILKLYMNEFNLNLRVLSFLNPHCAHLYLIKPRASGNNDEVYLVAVAGVMIDHLHTYGDFTLHQEGPRLNVVTALFNWMKVMKESWTYSEPSDIKVKVELDIDSELIKTPPLALAKMATWMGLNLSISSWSMMQKQTFGEFHRVLEAQIVDAMNSAYEAYHRLDDTEFGRTSAYTATTLTSKMKRTEPYFRLAGLNCILEIAKSNTVIHEKWLRIWFRTILTNAAPLFPDLSRLCWEDELFTSGQSGFDNQWNPYELFVEGANIGLSLLGTLYFEHNMRILGLSKSLPGTIDDDPDDVQGIGYQSSPDEMEDSDDDYYNTLPDPDDDSE
ncbi:hypothetical protein [Solanum melongena chuvirus-like virus]|nr:hypothetical protein [Solanum melongena chuvirus-like virus]